MFDDVAKSRIVAGAAATLSLTLFDSDGEPATSDTSTITIGIVNAYGTEVVAAGTATTDAGSGVRTYALTRAQTASVDRLVATWTDSGTSTVVAVTQHDIVGGVYYTTSELRNLTNAALKSEVKHSDADLVADRTEVEYQFESATGRAFVPRFWTDRVLVDNSRASIVLTHPDLRKVAWARYTVDGNTWTDVTNVDRIDPNASGIAWHPDGWPAGLIEVGYRYGWDQPTPEIKRAALTAGRYRRHRDKSGVDPRVMSMSTEAGTFNLATPGMRDWVTGIPEVDEVLNRPGIKFVRAAVA